MNTEIFSIDVHRPRVILVVARERSNTVVTEELFLVEHSVKDSTKTVFTGESEKSSITFTTERHVGNVSLRDVVSVRDEPFHTLAESWELFHGGRFESEGGVERDETDKTANGDGLAVLRSPRDLYKLGKSKVRMRFCEEREEKGKPTASK